MLYSSITNNMNPYDLGDPANNQVIYDLNGCFYLLIFAMFMSNISAVTLTFPAERAVFLKEHNANMYSVTSYFFGRSSTELPFVVFFPILVSAISYYIIGLNDHNVGKLFFFSIQFISSFLIFNLFSASHDFQCCCWKFCRNICWLSFFRR